MKKILVLLIILFSINTFAQKGFYAGLSGKVLTSSIVNQNVWGVGTDYDYVFTAGSGGGLDVGYNFTDNLGIFTGFGSIMLGQKYSDEINSNFMDRQLKLKYSTIPIMLKYNGDNKGVNLSFGIGIEYAMTKEVTQDWTKNEEAYYESGINPITDEEFAFSAPDVTERFENSDILGVFEIGARFPLIDQLFLNALFTGGYGIKDINQEDWRIENSDGNYDPSHNAFAAIKLGISYLFTGK